MNCPKSAAMVFFPKEIKNEFETAVVNEPSVFEPLKFYSNCTSRNQCSRYVELTIPATQLSLDDL